MSAANKKKIRAGARIKAMEGCHPFFAAGDFGEVVKVEGAGLWVRFDSSGDVWNIANRFALEISA